MLKVRKHCFDGPVQWLEVDRRQVPNHGKIDPMVLMPKVISDHKEVGPLNCWVLVAERECVAKVNDDKRAYLPHARWPHEANILYQEK